MAHRDDPRQMYREEQERLEDAAANGEVEESTVERIRTLLEALDSETRSPTFIHDGETTTLASSTLRSYAMRLRMLSKEVDGPLLALTNDDIDDLMDSLLDGDASVGPSDGYTNGTAVQFESGLKAFYRHHDGHEVDPEDIPVETQESSTIDERDLWTVDEIEAMRSVINSKRNEALFELLAYTGQRIRVIQTMRVKDVDPDKGSTGRYYVNADVEGRKNRDGHGPLLGAQGPIRRWLEVHPTNDPNDALITCPPDRTGGTTPGTRITQTTIRQVLGRIADKAGVSKDVHPHMFRHYFTTIAKKPKERGGFGMDSDHIKRLRGDSPGSNVMETTYAHLVDEDSASHAESAYTGEETENALTPAAPCRVCGEMLQAGDKACSNCGASRSPDAEKDEVEELRDRIEELEKEKQVQQDVGASKAQADETGVSEAELEAIAGDDALLGKLIEMRGE